MKKVILALAIVSVSFAACNNGAESTEVKTDTPAVETPKVDTPAVATPAVDTSAMAPKADTTKK